LNEVALHRDGTTASEVAKAVNLTPPTAHRLLRVLCDRKFVFQDAIGGRYRTGAQLAWITGSGISHEELAEAGRPVLTQLRETTGETVFLSVRDGFKATYLECLPSPQSVRLFGAPGMPIPLHASSQGKVILAFLPERVRERLIEKLELVSFTANTIVEEEVLRATIEKVRNAGFAVNMEEHEIGTHSVSAPVLDSHGNAVAAVCVGGPKFRVLEEHLYGHLAECVQSSAQQIAKCFAP
jgi:DNA-binding IclR family transcriptional regulator